MKQTTSNMFKVTTHTKANSAADFYIVSKGLNSGEPVKKPKANCFNLVTDKEVLLAEYAFLLVLNAHNNGAFKKYIKGSVIPFITINDFFKALYEFYNTPK